MEATYKTANGRLMIKVSADTQKDLFREIAEAQAVFDAQQECGKCACKEIRFNVRTLEKGSYYELNCTGCGAQFRFGQHKSGSTLFPKTKDGWVEWKKEQEEPDHGSWGS